MFISWILQFYDTAHSNYIQTFLNKVCKWQVSVTFSFWAIALFSWLICNSPVNAVVPWCESVLHLSTSMINERAWCPWRFWCDSAIKQVQMSVSHPCTGHMTSLYMILNVTKTFISMTLDRIELELCARRPCVCLSWLYGWYAIWPPGPFIKPGHLAWYQVKFSHLPIRVSMHVLWCFSKWEVR